MKDLHVFDKVIWKFDDHEYIVSRKRMGVNLYEICQVLEWDKNREYPKLVTNVHDGILRENLILLEKDECRFKEQELSEQQQVALDGSC